jgi:hypothetical protein
MDQSTFDYLYAHFEADFGVRPYVIRESSWDYPILRWENGQRVRDFARPIRTENSYLWGAAMLGYRDAGGVAAVGPGYDDSQVPGRGAGTIVDRQGGYFYMYAFWQAIQSRKKLIVIETWDEIHEASGIAESIEFGRLYIDLTRALVDLFHQSA